MKKSSAPDRASSRPGPSKGGEARPPRARGPSGRRAVHEGRRTCVGCGKREELAARGAELVRLVRAETGEVGVDARSGAAGRGANVHARAACLERALERGLARSLGGPLSAATPEGALAPLDAATLEGLVAAALGRRLSGVLAAARRRRELVVGGEGCEREATRLGALLVATDAGGVAEKRFVGEAVERGIAVALGSRHDLAALVGEERAEGFAVLGVSAGSIASEAVRVASSLASLAGAPRGAGARRAPAASAAPGSAPGGAPSARSGLDRGPEPSRQGSGLGSER